MSMSHQLRQSQRRISTTVAATVVALLALLAAACGSSEPTATTADASTTTAASTTTPAAVVPTATALPVATALPADLVDVETETTTTIADDEGGAPVNDSLANAIEIDSSALPFTHAVDTTTATTDDEDELGCPAPTTDNSVWYSITPTETVTLKVGAESDFPVGVSFAVGTPGSLELIECRPFAFLAEVVAGETYYFHLFDGDDPGTKGGNATFMVEEVTLESTEGLEPLGQDYVQTVAGNHELDQGALLFAVLSDDRVTTGSNGSDAAGNAPTADDAFRVGSITKSFTAMAALTLVDDGAVDLDASASDYVTRVPVPEDVTVRNLLEHRSGIFSYTETPGFFDATFADPGRLWTPEDAFAWAADEPQLFEPGSEFSYSNTNYVILGILIEQVTGQPYHEVLRERIHEPLGLSSTYLAAYEDGPEVFDPFDDEVGPGYDYTSIASGAWAGGGLVSSAADLHMVFTALSDGRIVSTELLNEMTSGEGYGLGLELHGIAFGHSGAIDGYEAFLAHSPEHGVTGFLATTAPGLDMTYAIQQLFAGIDALTSS